MSRPILLMFLVLLLVAGGLGFYAFHLKNKVASEEQRLAQQPQVAPPASGPTSLVTLYVASDIDSSLHRAQENVALPQERSERARAILRTLFTKYSQTPSPHPIGAGSDVRDVFLMGGDTAVIDTNAGFADSHPSGVLVEELTIASIVSTLNANDPHISRVKILIDGKERDTLAGHADLRRFYQANGIGQLLKEAQ